jgi:hypothetical protein
MEEILSKSSKKFVEKNSFSFFNGEEIFPTLWNRFTRLTFVHKRINERLTIDLDLQFKSYKSNTEENIPHIVIVEVKQEKASTNSTFIQAIKEHNIRQSSMSKYCVGMALIHKDLKQNILKNEY